MKNFIIKELISLANSLDHLGEKKFGDSIDHIIKKFSSNEEKIKFISKIITQHLNNKISEVQIIGGHKKQLSHDVFLNIIVKLLKDFIIGSYNNFNILMYMGIVFEDESGKVILNGKSIGDFIKAFMRSHRDVEINDDLPKLIIEFIGK